MKIFKRCLRESTATMDGSKSMDKSFKRCRESTATMDESKSKRLKLLSFGEDITTEILPLNSVYHRSPAMEKSNRGNRKSNQRPSDDDIETMDKSKRLELLQRLDKSKSKRHKLLSFSEDVSTYEILPLDSVYHPSPAMEKHNRCYRKSNHRCRRLGGEDISTEILLRLPVKSIFKFKTVSKLWLSIVSCNRFRQAHASRQSRAATDLFFRYYLSSLVSKPKISSFFPPVKRPDEYLYKSLTFVSSCNGLQLLKSSNEMYIIYNPTTHEYKLLDLRPHLAEYKYVCASLVFDPCESLHYKIIFLCNQKKEILGKFKLEVYSSTTGTCKRVSGTLYGLFDYDDNHGIFCNGAIHWLQRNTDSIVYFNVHTECISKLETPLRLCLVLYFGESQGHLHLVNTDHQYFYKSSVLYVNELKRDYSGWFPKYKVELASIISAFPRETRKDIGDEEEDGEDYYGKFIRILRDKRPFIQESDYCRTYMSIIRDEEEDGDHSTMVLLACGEWVEYNFKKKTTKRLCLDNGEVTL